MRVEDRKYYLRRRGRLHTERTSWETHWRELSEYIQPRRSRFMLSEQNQDLHKGKIINNAPARANNIQASGLMAGATSPSRPWYRLTLADAELADYGPVRRWLHIVEEILRTTFAKSNIYNGLHNVYRDLGWAGTSALLIDSDDRDILRAYSYPVGQYALATSARQQVDTFYLDLSMTVEQLVEKFGYEACSRRVRNHYDRQDYDTQIEVLFAIEPNRKQDPTKAGPKGMAWKAVWLEKDGKDTEGLLLESGYRDFPVLCPRWDVTGGDTYGYGPGMDALADCKALYLLERRKLQAFTKAVDPALLVPSTLLGREETFLPGSLIYTDGIGEDSVIRPAYTPHPQILAEFRSAIPEHSERIAQAFYADLWLAITNADHGEMTAREVAERHEEKLLQLGPAMERLEDELLTPLIDRSFSIHLERGFLPPPPDEMDGQELRVEYISILAQAQKLLGTNSLERLSAFTGNIANFKPDVVDKIDFDEVLDLYADALGVPPSAIVPDEEVIEIRQRRAEQEAQQAQMEQFAQMSQSISNLSGDIGDQSAIERLKEAYGG